MLQGRAFHLNSLKLGMIGIESQDKSCTARASDSEPSSDDLEQTPVLLLHTVRSNVRHHQSSTTVRYTFLTQAQCGHFWGFPLQNVERQEVK